MDNDDHIGPFNIGNPGEFTMIELAELVREVVNPEVEVRAVTCLVEAPSLPHAPSFCFRYPL